MKDMIKKEKNKAMRKKIIEDQGITKRSMLPQIEY